MGKKWKRGRKRGRKMKARGEVRVEGEGRKGERREERVNVLQFSPIFPRLA